MGTKKRDDDFVVDPSEIIVDRMGTVKEDTVHANPWIRFLARFFDYSLFFILLWTGRWLLNGTFSLKLYQSMVPIEFFAWIPIEALLLCTWGMTPGKYFLKVQLRQGRRVKLDFVTALRRSVNVWFRGLGMMIPVVNCICLVFAYYRLKTLQLASWDRDEHIQVSHRPVEKWRIVFAAFLIAAAMLFHTISKFIA